MFSLSSLSFIKWRIRFCCDNEKKREEAGLYRYTFSYIFFGRQEVVLSTSYLERERLS
jgi:hypothetical protein